MMVAQQIRSFHVYKDDPSNGFPGAAVALTAQWITHSKGFHRITAAQLIETLQTQFFLAAPTERINQFLVLLAVANGWDPKYLYYRKCKPTNLGIHRHEFEAVYPELVEKIEHISQSYKEAYEWVKRDFDEKVSQLGDWFPKMVKEFEEGLAQHQQRSPANFRWKLIRYMDGATEYC